MGKKSELRRLFKYLKPYKFLLFISGLASLFQIGLGIYVPYIMKSLMDYAIAYEFDQFVKYLYVTAITISLGVVFNFLTKYCSNLYTVKFVKDIRNEVTSHIQKLPIAKVSKYHSGDLVSRVNQDVDRLSIFLNSIPSSIFQPLLFIGAVTYMSIVSWKLLAATTILIPISSFVFNALNKPIQKHSKELMEETAKANAMIQDVINGVQVVKSFNLKEELTQRFNGIVGNMEIKGLKIDKTNTVVTPVFLILRLLPQMIYPLYGGYLALHGELTVGELFAFGALTSYTFGPVEEIMKFIGQVREVKPATVRIFEIIDEEIEEEGYLTDLDHNYDGILEFQNVEFSYNGDNQVLKEMNLKIQKGKTTALVGSSGSGKSTILKLLCGFYSHQGGNIKLFGKDIALYDKGFLRSQMSLISQDVYLFPTSIQENIAYGKENATKEEIIYAAKIANAHDFIMELPMGYDTIVGERGSRLSGGQCQRIALARAFLKDAPILLLDEPTSALDTQSEFAVQEGLKKLMEGRTVIIIAHRLSTIQKADEILVIDEGTVVEKGLHQELLAMEGIYKRLHQKNIISQDGAYYETALREV